MCPEGAKTYFTIQNYNLNPSETPATTDDAVKLVKNDPSRSEPSTVTDDGCSPTLLKPEWIQRLLQTAASLKCDLQSTAIILTFTQTCICSVGI